MSKPTTKTSGRIDELDLLRGYFILVIILDHAQRLPSIHSYLTGDGKLWVSAAEGFFLISGLLIGYVRGRKQRDVSLKILSKKLISRGIMLYVWGVGLTLLLTSLTILLPVNGNLVARVPDVSQVTSLPIYLWNVVSTQFVYDWVYFLRLYAIILVISPVFLWLIRNGKSLYAFIISIALYALSFLFTPAEGSLQWQLLFFTAAIAGYKLPDIVAWLSNHKLIKNILIYGSIVSSIAIFWVSYYWVLGWPDSGPISRAEYVDTRVWLDPFFVQLMPLRILVSIIWFSGLLSLFHLLRPYLMKWFSWLLMVFGQYSLSVYCLQAIALIFIQLFIPLSSNEAINLLLNVMIVMIIWGLIKVPLIRKLLPQ